MAALGPCPVTGEASCYCGDESIVRSDGTSSRHQAVLLSEVSGGLPGAALTVALSPALGGDGAEVVSVMLRTTIEAASFEDRDHVLIEAMRGDGSADVMDKLSYSFADAVFVSATTGYRIDNVGAVLEYDIGGAGLVALRISAGDRHAGDLLEIGTVEVTSYPTEPTDEAKAMMHSPAQSTQSDVAGSADLQDLTGGGSVTLAEAIASQGGHSGHGAHAEDAAKAAEHDALLGLFPDAADPGVAVALNGGSWFDPGTWSTGAVPGDGVNVYIPLGISVVLDGVSEARLDTVAVDGELHFAVDTNTRLVLDSLLTGSQSVLTIGTKANPVQSNVRAEIIIHADGGPVTSVANIAEDPSFLGHGVVTHGVVRIVGEDKADFLKAAVHPEAGDSALVFAEAPEGWRIGDKLVVAAAANQMNQRAQQIEIYEDEVVTIKAITANVDGTWTVELDQVLQYDHAPPQHQSDAVLQIPVANYTRNVFIGSETEADAYLGNGLSVPVEERGHVMFMHNSDVEVLNAEFFELGRTDKSILIKKALDTLRDKLSAGEIRDSFVDDVEDFLATEATPSAHNVGGRYALHFHRTGTDDLDNPAIAEGNAVWGSPGWGMVHHDANVNMFSNAVFGTVGSGMVAEAGNEAGIWADNIVIQTTGEVITFNAESSGYPFHPDYVSDTLDDTFRQGEAFAMKSRLLELSDNVAASANGAGFSFWPHGVSGPSHINSGVDAFVHANGFDPFYGQDDEGAAKVPTRDFSGNEVIGSRHALNTSSNKTPHRHDMDVLIEDLLAWNVDQAIMSFYQQNYIIKDSIFIKGTGNAEQFQFGGFIGENGSATHIHDAVDFKLINNYWEGWDVVVREPIEIITGNTVVGSTITEQTGPDGIFREGFTADNDSIDYLDNAPGWE
ncbi:MAG: G8 domain-containing protein, partial [Paracoccaceae bacterium]